MAKLPKNELEIKKFIAQLVSDYTTMKAKVFENIRLKNKSFEFQTNGSLENSCMLSESISLWTIVRGLQDEDYSIFENAINEAISPLFNSLQIISVRETMQDNNYQRYYEIKVN